MSPARKNLLVALLVVGVFHVWHDPGSDLLAQDDGVVLIAPDQMLPGARPFIGADGSTLVVGRLMNLEGTTVTLMESPTHKKLQFKLNEFSKEERERIRREYAQLRKIESRREDANKLAKGLAPNERPTTVIRTLNRLRALGDASSHLELNVRLLLDHENKDIAAAAAICFVNICERDLNRLRFIIEKLRDMDQTTLNKIARNPERFLTGMNRFGQAGLNYLRAVAYNGRLDVEPVIADGLYAEELDADQREIRIEAAEAAAESEFKEEAAELLLEMLDAELQVEDNGRSIERLIRAIGRLGYYSDQIVQRLEALESDYPEVAAEALERIRKNQPKDED